MGEEHIKSKRSSKRSVPKTYDGLTNYYQSIKKIKVLPEGEQFFLFIDKDNYLKDLKNIQSIQTEFGPARALKKLEIESSKKYEAKRDYICVHYLRLIISMAQKYLNITPMTNSMTDGIDLIQVSNLSMVRDAIPKFDPRKGKRFGTYLAFWMRREIMNEIMTNNTIKIPKHLIYKAIKTKHMIESKGVEKACKEYDWSAEKFKDVNNKMSILSTEQRGTNNPEDDLLIIDSIKSETWEAPDAVCESNYIKETIHEMLSMKSVSERDIQVIRMRFGLDDGEPKKLSYIAKRIGLTRERIRQIQNMILIKMRKKYKHHPIKNFLEKKCPEPA